MSKLALQYATHNSDQIATTLVGMCSPAQVRPVYHRLFLYGHPHCSGDGDSGGLQVKENVQSVIEAAQGQMDEQTIRELEELMAPIKGQGWSSGREENN